MVKDNVSQRAILKDLEESFCQASKEAREVLFPEEDWNLATTKEEIERFLRGRLLVSALVPLKANGSDQVLVTDAFVSILPSSTLSSRQVVLLKNHDAISTGALAFRERLRMSLGSGAPIYKQTVRYYWRAKKVRGIRMDDSLLHEVVESFSAPHIHYQSKPVAGFVAHTSSEGTHGQVSDSSPTPLISVGDVATQRKPDSKSSNLMMGFLRRGFHNSSPKEKRKSHSSTPVAVKDDEVMGGSSSVLNEAFKFGWDREDNDWDGELSPDPLDWVLDCDKEEDPYSTMLDDMKEDFLWVMDISQPWAKGKRPRNKGKRELLNLESFVNYGIANTSFRRRKGKISVS